MPKILIPDSFIAPIPPLPFDVVRFQARGPVTDGLDAEALVVWRIGTTVLHPLIAQMPKLRWIQTMTAGVDTVLSAPHLPNDFLLSNGSNLHSTPTAELGVTLLLSAVRQLHRWRDLQHEHVWDKAAYNMQLEGKSLNTLEDSRVVILGMGTIGLEMAHRLKSFGAIVEGVASTAGVRDGFTTHAVTDLLKIVPTADAIISVLPETPETQGILSRELIYKMQPHAWLVNIGRGSALDEAALVLALNEKRIAGAALDVTMQEPLPKESPLWDCKNLIISPHIAGGGQRFYAKAAKLLQQNAEAFVAGKPLANPIDPKKGY
ncbi:MAG: D-2-hydroxyacid dehydrogenase [Alphaproteobacteria bacterium]|nr:D-2-hydroxyacid dehydrogenase [Alphaproteobacteria bacterium]